MRLSLVVSVLSSLVDVFSWSILFDISKYAKLYWLPWTVICFGRITIFRKIQFFLCKQPPVLTCTKTTIYHLCHRWRCSSTLSPLCKSFKWDEETEKTSENEIIKFWRRLITSILIAVILPNWFHKNIWLSGLIFICRVTFCFVVNKVIYDTESIYPRVLLQGIRLRGVRRVLKATFKDKLLHITSIDFWSS